MFAPHSSPEPVLATAAHVAASSEMLAARQRATSRFVGPIIAAIAYYVAAKIGAALSFPSAPVSVFWAPNALLFAALLLAPVRAWPRYLAAVLPLHVLAQANTTPPEQIALQYVANCAEALIGAAALVRHKSASPGINNLSAMTNLIVIGGIAAPFVTSLIMAGAFLLLGLTDDLWLTVSARTITNTFATITVVPLILWAAQVLTERSWHWPVRNLIEAVLVGTPLLAVCLYVCMSHHENGAALLYAPLPFLIYATVRFGMVGVCTTVMLLGTMATWCVMQDGGPFASQSPVQNALATVFFLNVTCVPLLLLAAVLQERKQVIIALAKRELLHTSLMASLQNQIAVLDSRGVILEANDSWRQSPEHTREQEEARPGVDYLASLARAAQMGDTVACTMHEALCAVLSGCDKRSELEISTVREDGRHWFELSIEALQQHSEQGAVVTVDDITARKRAELEVHDQHHKLVHLARVAILGEFSGAIAHEIRQPLTAMQANAEAAACLLTERSIDKRELQETICDIVTDSRRAAQVIDRLQSMLRRTESPRALIRLDELVKDSLMLARADLARRHVSVDLKCAQNLPQARGDPVQTQQVILNLIANACDAMAHLPESERRLTLTTAPRKPNLIELCVSDCGDGIAEDQLARIFEPFVTSKPTGLGLGLSICRTIAAAQGGRLWAESLANGATFHLTLPIEDQRPSDGSMHSQ